MLPWKKKLRHLVILSKTELLKHQQSQITWHWAYELKIYLQKLLIILSIKTTIIHIYTIISTTLVKWR